MIHREHTDMFQRSSAVFSDCEQYRYLLRRVWDPDQPAIAFLMLNPSTADEMANDPTVERCQRRATAMGFGSMMIVNLFPLRSTDPKGLLERDPLGDVGAANAAIQAAAAACDLVICAWGNHKAARDRAKRVAELVTKIEPTKLHCLGVNADGSPKHPLYVGYAVQPMPWPVKAANDDEPARVEW